MQRSSSSSCVAPRHPCFRLPPLSLLREARGAASVAWAWGDSTSEASASPGKAPGRRLASVCSAESTAVPGTPTRRREAPATLAWPRARASAPQAPSAARGKRAASPVQRVSASWRRGRALGAGSFGTVFLAFDQETSRIFAVKEVPVDGSERQRERLSAELRISQELRHPNIVSYLGHDRVGDNFCIYLGYMPGGSVSSVLAEFGALRAGALRRATSGALQGLDYLHTRSPPVVHRDLKGANLLVDTDMTVKLSDFGCSKWCSETKSFTTLGSVPWMAPEVISQREGYGRKADIWSFGCTIIEMATAEKPWGSHAFDNVMFALNHIANSSETPPPPDGAPASCRDLVALCTQRSQSRRPSTRELLRHEFVASKAV